MNELNVLAHPKIELANWAANNLSKEVRKEVSMYTSGEHCPMCATAHGWVGLGEIVYLSSAAQLREWLQEAHANPEPVNFIPARELLKNTAVRGPFKRALLQEIKNLQLKYHSK